MVKGSLILFGYEIKYDCCPNTNKRIYYLFGKKFRSLIKLEQYIECHQEDEVDIFINREKYE
jgi:hypothetical protein